MSENIFYSDKHFVFESTYKNQAIASGSTGHYHNFFEVYYLLEGTCWYFIDKKSYHLTAGDIALIPPGVIHKTSYETHDHSRKLVFCDDFYLPASTKDVFNTVSCYAKNDKYTAKIDELFDRIEAEYCTPDEFSPDALRAAMYELLVLISRVTMSGENKKEESPLVEKTVKYIRAHYAEDISLADAAAYCYVSKEHLSRTFKKETGFGFNEYLTTYRLKKAESLIKGTSRVKVSDVAIECGFNDSNYFSKVYKKMYGKSPTKDKSTK